MATKRKDKSRVVLKTGEVQRKDGTYQFSWQDSQMKRRFVYARTLGQFTRNYTQTTKRGLLTTNKG